MPEVYDDSDEEFVEANFSDESDGFVPDAKDSESGEDAIDEPMDEMDVDEEEIEQEEVKIVAKPKRKQSQRGPGPAKEVKERNKKVDALQSLSEEQPVVLKVETAKPIAAKERFHMDSLRERMELFFGYPETNLLAAVKQRIKWGVPAFIPEQSLLDTTVTVPEAGAFPLLSSLKTKKTPVPPAGKPIVLDSVLLEPGQTRRTDHVAWLNVGGFVSALEWAPYHKDTQLLAVGVLESEFAVQAELSVFSKVGGSSQFFIYELDSNASSEKPSLKLYASYTFEYGPVKQFAWRPVKESHELAVVFQTGDIAVVKAAKGHHTVGKPHIHTLAKATSVCWRTPDALFIGSVDGSVSEFVDTEQPSFVYPLHYSVIGNVVSAYPEHPEMVFTCSVDGYCKVVDITDLRRSQANTPRAKPYAMAAAWCPFMESFVSLEDNLTTKLVPLRRPSLVQSGTNLTRHNSSVTTAAASRFHPMVLSGGLDGSVHICNALRRALVSRRNTKAHRDASIWALEYSAQSSSYRCIETLESQELQKHKFIGKVVLYPKQVAITGLCWCPSSSGAWYAAGTAGGLVRIENLAV